MTSLLLLDGVYFLWFQTLGDQSCLLPYGVLAAVGINPDF